VSRVLTELFKSFTRSRRGNKPVVTLDNLGEEDLQVAIAALKENVEIGARIRGEVGDSYITFNDLISLGFIDSSTGETLSTGGSGDTTIIQTNVPVPGPTGAGVPTGGSKDQVLKKNSATDYDTAWVNDVIDEAKRTDFTTNDTVVYSGSAAPGSLDSQAVWKIKRITFAVDGDTVVEYANGVETADQIWNSRLSLTYS